MFNSSHTSQTTETLSCNNPTNVIRNGASNLGCNGLTTSDQDLRKTRGELFSKLTERQPQQMIVTTPNKTISDENISNSARLSQTISATNARIQFACQKTSSDLNATAAGLDRSIVTNVAATNDLEMPTTELDEEPILFSKIRSRWYTNDEVASILTSFSSHPEWQTNELQVRPQSGAVLLYSREKVRYRQDGYCWKKRKNGRTTREDHMKLKVQGIECIYGCYVHSALLPTFHRRCYWLLENPDIVLVHYLNQPPDDKNKMMVTFNSSVLEADTRRRWTNEEIIEEIGSVFGGISQIHHTLSINLPTANEDNCLNSEATMSLVPMSGDADNSILVHHPHQHQLDPPEGICDMKGLAPGASGELLVMLPDDGLHSSSREQSLNYSAGKEMPDTTLTTITSNSNNRDNENEDDEMIVMNQDDSNDYQQSATRDPESKQQDGFIVASQHRTIDEISRGVESKTDPIEPRSCSPVTQIYNKIVDDIETYVLPLEMNQFDADHHHLHNQHNASSSAGVQPMDTSEQQQQQQQHQIQQGKHSLQEHQRLHQPQPVNDRPHVMLAANQQVDMKEEQSDISPIELLSCDLFANCNDFGNNESRMVEQASGGEDGCQQQRQQTHPASDMLLTDFNLQSSDSVSNNQAINEDIGGPDGSMVHAEEMRDLMMGMATSSEHPNESQQANQLLLGCENSDTLDLFDFKPLNCEHDYGRNHHQLDVKSTTSDTDALNRLSPIIPLVPRCNSTDNAMQSSSIQRIEQYQHHASSHFLSNTPAAPVDTATAPAGSRNQEEHLVQTFAEYDNLHHNTIGRAHRSTTSTEPSNSPSCSASPSTSSLLNAASATGCTSQSGASYTNGVDGGLPATYREGSTNSSFIKLPLPQRQNSEQREPSNGVLSSLLPKALSLDGSDLSSTGHRLHNHHHHHHHHHHNNHHNAHHQHHQSHHNRASPLVGSYHRGGGAVCATSRHSNIYGASNNTPVNQTNNHMLLIPSQSSQQPSSVSQTGARHHYYQRPSAPSLSPSSGYYSLDSSASSCSGGKVFVNGTQYRSGSVVAASTQISQQAQIISQQQQQQIAVSLRRLRAPLASHARLLPILDYVPNWSHSPGGAKILFIGNWAGLLCELQKSSSNTAPATSSASMKNASASEESLERMTEGSQPRSTSEGFSILFDDLIVPANLIQDNVLRCYSPYHEPGFIALKVLYKNLIVSEQVLFEIRAVDPDKTPASAAQVSSMASVTIDATAASASTGTS